MIRYALTCDRGHASESWFRSADAFDKLVAAGLASCPECGSTQVSKSLMAPQVHTARAAVLRDEGAVASSAADSTHASATHAPQGPLSTPRNAREAALAELRRRIESETEYVGMSFAAEARAIHEGAAPERAIWGETRPDEARALVEDGIPVAPLPFRPRSRQN